MGSMRKFGAALAIAGVMAGGIGSATLEAKKPGGGGGGNDAICEYLQKILDYPYVSPYVVVYVMSLAERYGCDIQ